ncbi:MAG TPA: DSD1 family PLP-dependent enzyme [Bryobacteraceae bacterium]|nr:DSD1 family PLP-dependent enzyme [Bryobacteraceae bacterium]
MPPATDKARPYLTEIEKMIEQGDLKRGALTRDDLPTPALTLDLDAFEANVSKMARYAKEHNRALRPHGKTHKCPEIAKALIRAGAAGACAAKIAEAAVFAQNGVNGILVTTAVVGKHKIERAARLTAQHPDTIFSVDNAQNVRDLNDASSAAKIRMNLAVDLWVGRRTGIQPGKPASGLAQLIDSLPNVKLAGLQAYAGYASHVIGFEERMKVSREAMAPAVETRQLIESKGIAVPFLSGGSTGTYNIDSKIDGISELQPGSFIFMDVDYSRIGGQDGPVYRDFRNALAVLTTVVSQPAGDVAVVDGGFKAFSTDKPFTPEARGIPGLTYNWAGDEHGIIKMGGASVPVKVGDRIEFVIPHCDPSVNLYDRIYCLRGDHVEAVWKIAARGMSQ